MSDPVDGRLHPPPEAIEAAAKAVLRWGNDAVPEQDRLSWGELDADWQKDMLAAAEAALRAALPSLLEAATRIEPAVYPIDIGQGSYRRGWDAALSAVRGLVPVDGSET